MTTQFERRHALLRILEERPGIRNGEIARLLDVSVGTIRNDLNALEAAGEIQRVRGGAVRVGKSDADGDKVTNQAAKQRIATRAFELVRDGDAIWLDAGTTVQMMIPLLNRRQNLTVITNGIETALKVAHDTSHQVLLIGGRIGRDSIYTVGTDNDPLLNSVNIKTAFISGVGFTVDAGLTVVDYEDAQVKTRAINLAENVVAMVDSRKIGKRGFAPFATVSQISHLITDRDIAPNMLQQLRRTSVNVAICGENTIQSHTVISGENRTKFVLGFANQTEQSSFAIDVRRGLERAAADRQDIDLVISDNKLSSAEALRVANHLINRRVDIAIEYQIDARTGSLLMDKFQSANIPVIAVDIPMVGATFFGVDNYRGGYMAGEYLGQWINVQWQGTFDHLIVLEEPRAGDLPRARIDGQLDGLAAHVGALSPEKMRRLDCGNTVAISRQAMTDLLQTLSPEARLAVICFNDEAAVGAIQSARQLDREKQMVVVGQGADRLGRKELQRDDSPLIGSTAYMPEQYGKRLIEIATNILTGISTPPAIYMEHVFLTKSNVDSYYGGYLTYQDG